MKVINFWDKSLALNIAKKESINMSVVHWVIIYYFRSYYFRFKNIPKTRNVLTYLNFKYVKKKYDSLVLFKLFPKGFVGQVLKISCLSSFVRCF